MSMSRGTSIVQDQYWVSLNKICPCVHDTKLQNRVEKQPMMSTMKCGIVNTKTNLTYRTRFDMLSNDTLLKNGIGN